MNQGFELATQDAVKAMEDLCRASEALENDYRAKPEPVLRLGNISKVQRCIFRLWRHNKAMFRPGRRKKKKQDPPVLLLAIERLPSITY